MSEFALQMRKISKTFGELRANSEINFNVKSGSIHALAGENGAGKSTLMKILFGLEEPDPHPDTAILVHGEKVRFRSPLDAIDHGLGMVQQHFALCGPLSALDNVILGAEPGVGPLVDRTQAEARLNELAGPILKLPWRKPTEDLSVGLQQRIEILKLLWREARILILDEPTAVLTPQEVDVFFKLLRSLKAQGKTIILITHKLKEVLSLCDDLTVLRQGRVTGQFPVAGLSERDIVRAMIGRELKEPMRSAFNPGAAVLDTEDLSAHPVDGPALNPVSLKVREREIVGIAGVEGSGQSTLVRALLGLIERQGHVHYMGKPVAQDPFSVRHKLNFGLISEDRHHQSLWIEASIAENCAIGFEKELATWGFLSGRRMTQHAQNILASYNVRMGELSDPIKSLSGGNQQKVIIAREVTARKPKFLISSQPTRGVDVGAIEFIYDQILALRDSGSAILLISSEIEELTALADRILVLFEGRLNGEFTGPRYDIEQIGCAMTGGAARHA